MLKSTTHLEAQRKSEQCRVTLGWLGLTKDLRVKQHVQLGSQYQTFTLQNLFNYGLLSSPELE